MPVTGSEEGVNPRVWQSSDSLAGIPLKKRKFMFVRPPSPEPEIPSSPEPEIPSSPEPAETPSDTPEPVTRSSPQQESHHEEEQCVGKSVPSTSNASSPTEFSGFGGCNSTEKSIPGKGEESSADGNVSLALDSVNYSHNSNNVGAVSTGLGSEQFHGCNSTEKSIPGKEEEGSADGNVSLALNNVNYSHNSNNVGTVSTGLGSELSLQLAPSKNVVPEIGKEEVIRKTDCSMGVEIELTRNPIKTELLFVSKVSADNTALAGEQPQRISKDQDKLDPYKWNLGLPNGQKFSNSSDLQLALSSSHDANRTHWDLNTTMEKWEGSLNGEAAVARNGLTDAVDDASTRDIKPVIGSSQIINKPEGSNVDLGKKILNKSKQQCRPDDLLRLGVHPLVPQSGLSLGPCFPKGVDSGRVTSNLRLPERPAPPAERMVPPPERLVPPPERSVLPPKLIANRIVKSEPSDVGSRLELVAKVGPPKSVPSQGCNAETHKPSKIPQTSVTPRVVKSEPGQGVCIENPKRVEKVFMQAEIRPLNSVVQTPSVAVASDTPISGGISHAVQFPVAGLSNTKEVADHALLPAKKEMLVCGDVEQGASNNAIAAVGSLSQIGSADGKESKSADDTTGQLEKERLDVANPDDTKLNLTDGHHSEPLENREASKSDEKVDIPAKEEFSHETDCNQDTNAHCIENNDCENGEVQKSLEHSAKEDGLGKVGEVLDDARNFPDVNRESASDVDMDISESDDCAENSESILLDQREGQGHSAVAFMKEPLPAVAPIITKTQEEEFIKYVKQLDQTERELQRGNIVVLASDVVASRNTGLTAGVALHEDINKRLSSLGASSSVFSKTESHVNSEEIAKDFHVGGNRSRIINLPRASSSVSQSGESGKNPIDGMVLSLRNQGEGSSDADFKGEKFRGRGNRDGRYMDPRFERKRYRDHQPFRSSGSEFRHSRGRVDNRVRSMRDEWDPEFSTEHGHGPSNFRFTRSKDNTSSKYEGSEFVPRGGRTVGTGRGRGGRKSLDTELQSYRHPPSRRRSPGGREGPVSRSVRIRRGPRDNSPDRCIPEDDPDLIRLRHEQKFMRVLPGEVMTKEFSRSQTQYERLEDSFLHGNQRFLPMQRRIPLHMPEGHSKSPPRSRTRSPGPWSSPRRRSPDEFVGHPDLNNCRSPRLYRIERMRSPQRHPCFAEGMVVRRNGSPPQYISRPCNDSREMGSSRELDHPRSYMRSRSPSGQIVPRNARRFVVDPRERSESDDLLAEAIHSGRFHDFVVGNGGEDDRRNGIERPGQVRSFHPSYNGNSDVVNFHHHDEDGPLSRPYRFIPEDDAEIHERGNTRRRGFERGSLRGRGFERQLKNQPDKAPPRTRSPEEQEENYWQSEQQNWHEMSPF